MEAAERERADPAHDMREALEGAKAHGRRLAASNEALSRSNADLRTRLAEVHFMHEFVKSLVAFNRVDDVCSIIVDGCAGIFGAEVSAVYLADSDTSVLRLRASQGRPVSAFAPEVAADETLLGQAFERGFVLEEDADQTAGLSAWLVAPVSAQSQVALVLAAGGERFGVLALAWSGQRHLSQPEIERLRVVGDQSSLSLSNALLHAELERLSVTDRLTELFNHGYLHQRLDQEVQRAKRFGRELSVIMLDIDDFKSFNDRYGHPRGDGVLKDVSAIIRENLREMDIAARYGGEEFAAVLPETDAEGALAVAERIRSSVAGHSFAGGEEEAVHRSVSVGVATFPAHAREATVLIERADGALYRAKRAGKNRVEIAAEA